MRLRKPDAKARAACGVFLSEFPPGSGNHTTRGGHRKAASIMGGAGEHGTDLRPRVPLAVRGSSTHTFRSIGLFAEGGLLFCGGYLLAEAMGSPLQAGAMSVIGGGLFLALATVLLFYLAWPTYAKSVSRREQRE